MHSSTIHCHAREILPRRMSPVLWPRKELSLGIGLLLDHSVVMTLQKLVHLHSDEDGDSDSESDDDSSKAIKARISIPTMKTDATTL